MKIILKIDMKILSLVFIAQMKQMKIYTAIMNLLKKIKYHNNCFFFGKKEDDINNIISYLDDSSNESGTWKKSWYTEINKIATPSYHKIENKIKLTKEQNRWIKATNIKDYKASLEVEKH